MIRFYIDGTAGQKDGTEVTSINPITATGLFPSGSTEATKTVTVCIRADEGESYNQIMLGCNSEDYSKCRISSYNNTGVQIVSPNTNWDFYLIKTVTDTNQSFNLTFYAKSSETGNVDTSVSLYAYIVDLMSAADTNFIGDSYDNGNMVMITVPAGVNVLKLYIQRSDNKFDTLLLGVQPSKMYMIQRMDTADGNNNLRLVCNTQSGQVDIYQGHAATDAEHALMIHSPLQFWYSAAIERETPDVTAVPFA